MSSQVPLLTPTLPSFQLPGAGGPPTTLPQAPVPHAPLGAPSKNFWDSGMGKFINGAGGLGGLFDIVGKARDAFGKRDRPAASTGGGTASGPTFSDDSGSGGPPPEATILGLPPLAFGAVAVVLITALVVLALRMGK